jgi:hypothetical protein
MELVISISVFMIFLTIAAGSYASLTSANRKANDMQKLYAETRRVFDAFSEEIKSGYIDFNCVSGTDPECLYNSGTEEKKVLRILHDNGRKRTIFKFDETNKKIMMATQPGGSFTDFTGKTLPVDNLTFDFFPLVDPYDSALTTDDALPWQPTITITLQTGTQTLRTTYTSRNYGK